LPDRLPEVSHLEVPAYAADAAE